MSYANLVVLQGRLTKDPQLKVLKNSLDNNGQPKKVVNFILAVDSDRVNKQTGQREADFISCVAWGHTAELVAQYGYKGKKLGLNGHLSTHNYTDKETGKLIKATEVTLESVGFPESKAAEQARRNQQNYGQQPQYSYANNVNPNYGTNYNSNAGYANNGYVDNGYGNGNYGNQGNQGYQAPMPNQAPQQPQQVQAEQNAYASAGYQPAQANQAPQAQQARQFQQAQAEQNAYGNAGYQPAQANQAQQAQQPQQPQQSQADQNAYVSAGYQPTEQDQASQGQQDEPDPFYTANGMLNVSNADLPF